MPRNIRISAQKFQALNSMNIFSNLTGTKIRNAKIKIRPSNNETSKLLTNIFCLKITKMKNAKAFKFFF